MLKLTLVAALAVSLPAAAAPGADAPGSAAPTVLHCAHLIDTDAGKLLGESTIVIAGERIREVRSGRSDVAGANAIDLDGTCLPGLIDSHTHLTSQLSPQYYTEQFRLNAADYAIRSVGYAKRTLEAGFTTVRNLGDNDYNSVALRNAINAGVVVGPRIYTAGTAIGSSGGHADGTNGYRQDLAGDPGPKDGIVNSVEDAWKTVRLHYKNNVDVIKIMPSGGVLDEGGSADNAQLTLDEVKALVAAAHDYGFTVAAHAHGAEGIRRAIVGGVDSIEHGTYLDDADIKLM
jgi:imidazolonepropionase-like amidohydrolase